MFFKKFEDIEAWKTSRELVKKIYFITNSYPFSKDFGLRDQLQRASVSIMLNIAEGFGSRSNQSFINFLRYSFRSSYEVKSIMYVALDMKYIKEVEFNDVDKRIQEIQKMISGLIAYLKKE
jgi:four helix bundle protein